MTIEKSGFVAIVGRPNVGKSTLLNRIVGQKIAIMSDKAQTTRNKIQGVYTTDTTQIVFIDTPGIHKPKHRLGDYMVEFDDPKGECIGCAMCAKRCPDMAITEVYR